MMEEHHFQPSTDAEEENLSLCRNHDVKLYPPWSYLLTKNIEKKALTNKQDVYIACLLQTKYLLML